MTGQVPAHKIAAWEAAAYQSAVVMTANQPTREQRRRLVDQYESCHSAEQAERFRRDVEAAFYAQRTKEAA
jgi:hypothetical protein